MLLFALSMSSLWAKDVYPIIVKLADKRECAKKKHPVAPGRPAAGSASKIGPRNSYGHSQIITSIIIFLEEAVYERRYTRGV